MSNAYVDADAHVMEEIDEILEREELRNEHKLSILGENAPRFYRG